MSIEPELWDLLDDLVGATTMDRSAHELLELASWALRLAGDLATEAGALVDAEADELVHDPRPRTAPGGHPSLRR